VIAAALRTRLIGTLITDELTARAVAVPAPE
jgi:DNA-binding transcriptional regulator LsrR (DeoR family)